MTFSFTVTRYFLPESEEMFETMNLPDHLADTPIWESLYDRGSAAAPGWGDSPLQGYGRREVLQLPSPESGYVQLTILLTATTR